MPPVASSQHSVYCALPGPILPRSLLSVALTYAAAPGPVTITLPRWLTSKMPTASRTAVCSLTTPEGYSSGIDQPPNSANFAPERDVPVVQRRLQQRRAAARSRRPCARTYTGLTPLAAGRTGTALTILRPVTTYHLRSASPAKTRADAVVVGAVQTAKGVALAAGARGRRRGVRPHAAAAAQHARLHRQGRRGRQGADRRHAPRPLLVLVGLGEEPHDRAARLLAVRRAAGRRGPRRPATPPRSRWRCPPTTPALVRAVTEGYLLGGYTFTPLQVEDAATRRAGTVTRAQPGRAPRRRRPRAFEEAQVVADAVGAARDWVNTPAGDLTPAAVRRRGQRPRPRARKRQGRHGPRREAAGRARLRRHPRRRRRLERTRRGWSS